MQFRITNVGLNNYKLLTLFKQRLYCTSKTKKGVSIKKEIIKKGRKCLVVQMLFNSLITFESIPVIVF